jgi:glutamate dehydrogenase (NAD(P)+)
VVGYDEAQALDPADLLLLAVDVLVPAAVEGVLTGADAGQVQARIVVEGANGPTTNEADAILDDNGVMVVPDILANAGGVVVSYFEWVQANQAYWWTAGEVEGRLESRMRASWEAVFDVSRTRRASLRRAATLIAVERAAEAHLRRGLYP